MCCLGTIACCCCNCAISLLFWIIGIALVVALAVGLGVYFGVFHGSDNDPDSIKGFIMRINETIQAAQEESN